MRRFQQSIACHGHVNMVLSLPVFWEDKWLGLCHTMIHTYALCEAQCFGVSRETSLSILYSDATLSITTDYLGWDWQTCNVDNVSSDVSWKLYHWGWLFCRGMQKGNMSESNSIDGTRAERSVYVRIRTDWTHPTWTANENSAAPNQSCDWNRLRSNQVRLMSTERRSSITCVYVWAPAQRWTILHLYSD